MRILSRAISVLITAILLAALAESAHAQAFLYAGKRRKVNCGVVVVNAATQPLSAGMDTRGYPASGDGVGDLFFLLEVRTDMKPAGWSFDNPLAPGSAATGLSKSDPRYWQVYLDAAPDLSRMHVLYLPASGILKLTAQQREKLRQFVDGGGVLWIDNDPPAMLDFADTFFIPNFLFQSASGSDFALSRHHPLLSLPFWLSDWDVANLGSSSGQAVCIPGFNPGGTGWSGTQPTSFDVLYPVVGNTGGMGLPSVAANAYGSGRIVATSTFVGRGCYLNSASLKFAYNVIAWSSSWTHLRKDPRHTGASIDTVGGTKLLEVWSLPVAATGGGSDTPTDVAPVIYKNVAFYSAGNTLYALDLVPQEDLDRDGNPDDGLPGADGLPDKGQDIIWTFRGDGNLSAPSIVTAQDPRKPDESIEAVLVASSGGTIFMLPAFPANGNGQLLGAAPPILTRPYGQANSNPGPPLYVNGWIYATCGDGRLYAYNPTLEAWNATGTGGAADVEWWLPTTNPGVPNAQGTAAPRAGPNFGYVTSDSSGATVGMVYWFAGPWQLPDPRQGSEQNDHVYAVPVQVCNDRVKVERIDGTRAECRLSYSQALVSSVPAPFAFIRSPAGAEMKAGAVLPNTGLSGGTKIGYVVVEGAAAISPDSLIHVTYSLDYASPEGIKYSFAPRVRQPLEPRSNSQNGVPTTTVASMPALGPDNMIYLAGTRGNDGPPAIYGLANDGSTQYSRWIYLLHGTVRPELLSGHLGADAPIPGVVYNSEGGSIVSPKVNSSPAVWGDKVFVTVSGDRGNDPVSGKPAPSAALMCFRANSNFVVRITENAGYDTSGNVIKKPKRLLDPVTGRQKNIMLWQPNLMPGGGPSAIPLQVARAVRRDMVDYEKGTVTFSNFDQLKLLGGPLNVQATNCFSPSLPVYVFVDNVEVPIDWSTWAPTKALWDKIGIGPLPRADGDSVDLTGWNNLLWFFTVPDHKDENGASSPCGGIHSSPVVIGNNVYFVCDDGYLYCYPAEPGETAGGPADPKLLVWEGKIAGASGGGGGSGETANLSMAGSNGVLLVPTPDGLHAYTNATTLVADSNRLVEIDGAGEIKWSLSSVSWPVGAPRGATPAMTSGPINKPSRARYLPSGEMLLVNSAANQVCRVDKSGTAGLGGLVGKFIRGVYDRFVDPKNLLRPGRPTSISSPTDAIFWQEYEKQPNTGGTTGNITLRIDHCVIADSGNHRIIDLVYKFNVDANGAPVSLETGTAQPDPATGFYLPELNWVTVTDSTNERYVYECLQLVPNPLLGGMDIWAAVSNYRGALQGMKVRTEGLGGAIFALGYRRPGSGGASWDYWFSQPDDQAGRIVAACDMVDTNTPLGVVPLAAPRYFQVIDRPAGRFMLICDNYGVYEIVLTGAVPPITRAFWDQSLAGATDYRRIEREMMDFDTKVIAARAPLGVPLVASSVQELMNGNWLITNSYSGSNTAGDKAFSGEVFEINWRTDPPAVVWSSPGISVLNGDPATWKQRLENSYIFQQPRSAVRQM